MIVLIAQKATIKKTKLPQCANVAQLECQPPIRRHRIQQTAKVSTLFGGGRVGGKQNAERLCLFVKVSSPGRYSQILNEKSAPVLKLGLPFCRLKESKKVDLH